MNFNSNNIFRLSFGFPCFALVPLFFYLKKKEANEIQMFLGGIYLKPNCSRRVGFCKEVQTLLMPESKHSNEFILMYHVRCLGRRGGKVTFLVLPHLQGTARHPGSYHKLPWSRIQKGPELGDTKATFFFFKMDKIHLLFLVIASELFSAKEILILPML
jgi:hypothetical protein